MTIVKCVILCEVCGKVDSIQLFYSKDGSIRYARARHYQRLVGGKPTLLYHPQTLDYIEGKLNQQNLNASKESIGMTHSKNGSHGHTLVT